MTSRFLSSVVLLLAAAGPLAAQSQRPMEFADLWRPTALGAATLSPDGRLLLYTATPGTFPDPPTDSQIHVAAMDGSFTRQLTQGSGAGNQGPVWHPSGERFGFLSTRGGDGRQVHIMSLDGGEARKVTDAEGGVAAWAWSDSGAHLAFLTGDGAERQVWIMDGEGNEPARRLTDHPTPIDSFRWRHDGSGVFYVAADDWDEADHRRREAGFEARPVQRGLVFDDFLTLYPQHLWTVGTAGGAGTRVTGGDFIVHGFEESPDGAVVALAAGPVDPHADSRPNEIHLLDLATGTLERLTENHVSENIVGFSPDGRHLAITAGREFRGRTSDVFVRPVAGGEWTALTASFDNNISGPAWAEDSESLFFVGAEGVYQHLYEVDLAGSVRQVVEVPGVVSLQATGPGDRMVVAFSDPTSPRDLYALDPAAAGGPSTWTRLTRANPWIESVQLATTEVVRWTSTDGTEVEGILVYPLDHQPGRAYPLITEMHGGPASAFEYAYLPTTPHRAYGHILAGRGYGLFLPNYRGSSNYGEEFQAEISGDYWTRATEDILTGIDHLVDRGIAHPDSLGVMGWSAGGHWSNWLLVQTDRFKAIASGAGVANWVSMYGQTDNQSSREFYLGKDGGLDARNRPWDDFDHWWNESPLKYIQNAKTPTLFHYGEKDQRVPMPQGQELHMALKSLGVPTQFLVYPDELHALVDRRNQLVKLMADLGWFDTWIRGEGPWLDWGEVMEVADEIEERLKPGSAPTTDGEGGDR